MKRPRAFITFEGIEGSGKSTQIARLAAYLRRCRAPVTVTREPGGTPTGERIRKIFLGAEGKHLNAWTELFLVEAARAQHLAEVVRPALDAGRIVLCDRYTDSTIAYQGYGRGLPLPMIRSLHGLAGLRPRPDLTLMFDLPVRQGLLRARGRNAASANRRNEGRLDAESASFHAKVQRGFREIVRTQPRRSIAVDATGTPAEIADSVRRIVLARLARAGFELRAGR